MPNSNSLGQPPPSDETPSRTANSLDDDWSQVLYKDALAMGRTPDEAREIVEVARRWAKIRAAYAARLKDS
jgi:hypothetical protein